VYSCARVRARACGRGWGVLKFWLSFPKSVTKEPGETGVNGEGVEMMRALWFGEQLLEQDISAS
jgi:hypothetical protein